MNLVNGVDSRSARLEIGDMILLGQSEGFLKMTLLMTVTPYNSCRIFRLYDNARLHSLNQGLEPLPMTSILFAKI
jgi:hypothetical protein